MVEDIRAEERIPVFVSRKATVQDLPVLNEKFYSGKEQKLGEADLGFLVVMEINGKVRGLVSYDGSRKGFLEVSGNSVVLEVGKLAAEAEFERASTDSEGRVLAEKHGVEEAAKIFEKQMLEFVEELKRERER